MDWKEIAEKYPKSFELCEKFRDHLYFHDYQWYEEGGYGYFDIRDLYDFFDEHKLYITIGFYTINDTKKQRWGYIISSPPKNRWEVDGQKDRKTSEDKVFTKAFGFLEAKL